MMNRLVLGFFVFSGVLSLGAQTASWQPSPGHTQLPIWPGIALLSVAEPNVDNTAAGRMAAGVHGVFNQYFSDALSEKMKDRSAASVRAGRWPWAAPLGYVNDLALDNGANIKPDPSAAPLLCEAFELYATGQYTKIQVLKIVTDKGLKTKRGLKLTAQTFDALLRKPIYAGWTSSPFLA